ncbi:MAG: ribose-phosphate pyrophosphokinase [Sphingomicrobium sp.]
MSDPAEPSNQAGLLADPVEARAILIACAKAGEAITYSEMLALLGFAFTRPKMRALCTLLGVVDDEAEARGEPELAVLVVRQSDGLPGQGWWVEGARKHGHGGSWEGPSAARLIRRIQARAFEFWAGREA